MKENFQRQSSYDPKSGADCGLQHADLETGSLPLASMPLLEESGVAGRTGSLSPSIGSTYDRNIVVSYGCG
jgi:hypothetical protein